MLTAREHRGKSFAREDRFGLELEVPRDVLGVEGGEGVRDGHVSREKIVPDEVRERNPRDGVMHLRIGIAVVEGAPVREEAELSSAVIVGGFHEELSHAGGDAELLSYFALESDLGGFARLELTPGIFPVTSAGLIWGSAGEEDLVVVHEGGLRRRSACVRIRSWSALTPAVRGSREARSPGAGGVPRGLARAPTTPLVDLASGAGGSGGEAEKGCTDRGSCDGGVTEARTGGKP